MGDFSARIQKAYTEFETSTVGQHTFDKHNHTIYLQEAHVTENRSLLITHCDETKAKLANTWFENQKKIIQHSKDHQ